MRHGRRSIDMTAAEVTTADKPKPESLHQRILADIEGRILSAEWPPGRQIPFEQDLAVHYGCSRMTVNKVMTQLAAAGLIERRRKAGSFVRRPQSYSAVLEIIDIGKEVEALGLPYRFEITRAHRRASTRLDASRLELRAPAEMLDIVCRHFAADQPFCVEDRLINLDVVPDAAEADFTTLSPGAWLVAEVPWTMAEHKIRAIGADKAAAEALGIAVGTPCLSIERRTWRTDKPVTFVRLTYPGDGHEVLARFAPSQA